MNKQEVFDTVKAHLLEQNEKAIHEDGVQCQYLTDNGLKCAVGCLIPGNIYDPYIEGTSVSAEGTRLHEMLLELGLYEHVGLLSKLQCIHDDHEPSEWKELLDHFQLA